ncbi:MAG: hypothetical protein WBW49_13365 [Candidatus Acidiferrum sp.]
MKLKLKVTGASKLTDDKLLVQLQGKFGNAQLNLPIHQQKFVQVGDEWTLDSGKATPDIAELDETEKPRDPISIREAAMRGALDGLGKDSKR